jgi:hypothetical protein
VALLLTPLQARADNDCQLSFERWVKMSEARVHQEQPPAPNGAAARGPCLAGESVRKELLDALAHSRQLCAQFLDQSLQQTKVMLDINENFVRSLAICPSEHPEPRSSSSWATKAVPSLKAPRAPTPPCLQISPVKQGQYLVANERCQGATVLAVIEMPGRGGTTECRGMTVGESVKVRSSENSLPRVNLECILDQPRCSKARLGKMFPECDW